MQSPTQAGLADAGQTSEEATPGASVAAVHSERHAASAFDTPLEGLPSTAQAVPAVQNGQAGHSHSKRKCGATGPSLEAAAEVMAAADAAAVGSGPLSAPRLRVQGADIILEDAASPPAPASAQPSAIKHSSSGRAAEQAAGADGATAAALQTEAAAAAAGGNHMQAAQQQQGEPPATSPAAQYHSAPQQHHLVAAARASQSHDLELQLRLASRSAATASHAALVGSRATQGLPSGADERLRGLDGGRGDTGPSSSAPAGTVEGPVRMKYRSTLTEENVAYLNKLEQYATRPDAAGRSPSERIWKWLEGSGPPFDNPPPSLGVPSVNKGAGVAAASRRQGDKRPGGFLSCFGCFGGGAASSTAR